MFLFLNKRLIVLVMEHVQIKEHVMAQQEDVLFALISELVPTTWDTHLNACGGTKGSFGPNATRRKANQKPKPKSNKKR